IHAGCSDHVIEILLKHVYEQKDVKRPYTSFDQHDVIQRMRPEEKAFFPWSSAADWKKELSDPSRVRMYLDVLDQWNAQGSVGDEDLTALRNGGYLPDYAKEPTQWNKLYWSRKPVDPIPGVVTPHCIHQDLVDHRVLHTGRLKLTRFVL